MSNNALRSSLIRSGRFSLANGDTDYAQLASFLLTDPDSARPHKPAKHVPGTSVSLLTNTSKMPSWSWSLPAGRACPASKIRPDGHADAPGVGGWICEGCYADPANGGS